MSKISFTRADLTAEMDWKYDSAKWDFNKNLNYKTLCRVPYKNLLIDKNGDVYICMCQAWLPISIGNILDYDSLDKIYYNKRANTIRSSIEDGSYRYCDVSACGFDKDEGGTTPFKPVITNLTLGIDESCNLSCPSCRESMIYYKKGKDFEFRNKLGKHIGTLLSGYENPINFILAGDGEVFASFAYKKLIENLSLKDGSSIMINTNGLLMRQNWSLFDKIEKHITTVAISLDAATEETYSLVRRGGSWKRLLENIIWLRKTRPNLYMNSKFVVQSTNYHEIADYVKLSNDLGFDTIEMQAVTDWGTWHNFSEHAIWMVDHPKHTDLVILLSEIKKLPKVKIDKILGNICQTNPV